MEADKPYMDLTEEEEARLPLPEGWSSTIKMTSGDTARLYKNVRWGTESTEHPYILQAQALVKKEPTPAGWSLKTARASDGTSDAFYFNEGLNVSMWDHPLLKKCLCECLTRAGHDPRRYGIARLAHTPSLPPASASRLGSPAASRYSDESVSPQSVSVVSAGVWRAAQGPVGAAAVWALGMGGMGGGFEEGEQKQGQEQRQEMGQGEGQGLGQERREGGLGEVGAGRLYMDDLDTEDEEEEEEEEEEVVNATYEASQASESVQSEHQRDWEGLLHSYREEKDPPSPLRKTSVGR
ncbi:hypothetical protein B484DRAFT_31489 [Ochromonadaceae sp. CCMP2298]|nr:hypothetical protein B484DRAFT_31489 [Ochromonadaceae sp. CCMP2298]